MSAPVTDRPRAATRTAPRPSRTGATPVIPAQRGAPATRRAYARRDERLRRLLGGPRPARSPERARRAQFVLLVMVLLAGGLVLTLGLSTAAAADSYRLQAARDEAGRLTDQMERLRREVAVLGSAPEIADRARGMGMVRVEDPARIVVAEDGSVTLVGEPSAARAPAPVVPPTAAPPAADPAAADPAAGGVATDPAADPAASDPAATDPAGGTAPAAGATDPAAGGGAAEPGAGDPGGTDPGTG